LSHLVIWGAQGVSPPAFSLFRRSYTLNALRFEAHQEKNLLALKEELDARTYHPSCSVCFVSTRPKLRKIFAADFKDRIVHHILVDHLERIFEPIFIHDSYACRKGKGVHKGVLRLEHFIRQVTANGSRPAYYIQLDIKNYFMSIDKEILFSLLAGKIRDEAALWLTRLLDFHDCTDNSVLRGEAGLLRSIPTHKTLFHAPKSKGLPIGNLNSQFFANVYLNGLDQFVKHRLKCRYYLRYCDDFVLLSKERDQLLIWRERIEAYLKEELQLELNRKRQRLQPVSNGIDFLGYIVRGDYLLVRRRVVNNLRTKLGDYETRLVKDGRFYRRYRFDESILDSLAAMFSSYLGHFKMADTYSLSLSLWKRHAFLSQYFDFDHEKQKLIRKYEVPRGFKKIRQQYLYYNRGFPEDVILFQAGSFFEFYHAQDRRPAQLLGLSKMGKNRRGARYGFPVRLVHQYFRRLFRDRKSVLLVLEKANYWTGIKERLPVYRFEPLTGD